MSVDPEEQRRQSREHWEEASVGWERRQEGIRDFLGPVAQWLVEAIHPQPGHEVLEVAAGVGETGFLAAELIAPGGRLTSTDQAEGMVEAGRRRARELGVTNVDFKVMDAEWLDFPVASFDAVICRFGYMLMSDPQAALGEARRVLRPGGRIALAVWDALDDNPWAALTGRILAGRGLIERPQPGTPGPFALGDADRLREMVEEAGFADVEIERVAVAQRHPDAESFWEGTLDLSRVFHDAVMSRPESEIADIRTEVTAGLEPYRTSGGGFEIPGVALAAAADA